MRVNSKIKSVVIVIFFAIISFVFVIPFIWMVSSSFKPSGEIFTESLSILPKNPTLEGYRMLLDTNFVRWYFNSLIFAGTYVILSIFVCSLAGFAFSKYNFRFKNILFISIIASHMLPIHMYAIPLFIFLNELGILNTYTGLILPMVANPFALFFVRQYMIGLEDEIIDAARIDGCSEFQIYYKIILPLAKPALAAMAIILSLFAWNNLFWPLIVARTSDMFTLTVGISSLIGRNIPQYQVVMAGSVLVVAPIVILFLNMQKHFIAGLTAGSIK